MANPWTKKNPLLSMWLSGDRDAALEVERKAARDARYAARKARR